MRTSSSPVSSFKVLVSSPSVVLAVERLRHLAQTTSLLASSSHLHLQDIGLIFFYDRGNTIQHRLN
jgi:hypothetical protein